MTPFKFILAATDFSVSANGDRCWSRQAGGHERLRPRAGADRFHASESVIRAYRVRQEVALLARMRRSMTRLGLYARKLSFALGRGSPVKATLEQVQSQNADVLVATKQRRGHVATSVLGHINSLLARSRCDMLIGSRDKPAELLLDPQAMTNYCLHPTAKRLNPLDFHGKRPAPTARQPRSGNPEDAAASRVQDGQTNRPSASYSDIDGQGRSIP